MKSRLEIALLFAAAATVFAGCGGPPVHSIGGGNGPNVSVSIVMTDTPPAGVSVLSFLVTLSSAKLSPGNVSLLSSPVTVEVTRLQADQALLNTQNVAAGSYTGVTLTFANPVMTFQNNGASAVTVGTTNCAVGAICTAQSPTLANSSVSVTLPLTLTTNVPAALLVNLNLSNFLTNPSGATMAADAQASGAVSVTQLTSTSGAPFTTIEDVVGIVSNVSSGAGTFQLQTALGNYSLATSTGTSGTAYVDFPSSGVCPASPQIFACVANGQIVSANFALQANGSLLATNVLFEDANSSEPEIEGLIVSTSGTTFNMVVLQETPSVSGVPVGGKFGVTTQSANFDIDDLGATPDTSQYVFSGSQSLIVGQQVQVLSASVAASISADRVRLRSSRIAGFVTATAFPQFTIGNGSVSTLPPFLISAGIPQITVLTLTPPAPLAYTELGGGLSNINQISLTAPNNSVAVRGQLFATGSTPALVATKVILN